MMRTKEPRNRARMRPRTEKTSATMRTMAHRARRSGAQPPRGARRLEVEAQQLEVALLVGEAEAAGEEEAAQSLRLLLLLQRTAQRPSQPPKVQHLQRHLSTPTPPLPPPPNVRVAPPAHANPPSPSPNNTTVANASIHTCTLAVRCALTGLCQKVAASPSPLGRWRRGGRVRVGVVVARVGVGALRRRRSIAREGQGRQGRGCRGRGRRGGLRLS